jgi:gliding motility-associated-like protein
LQLTTIRSTISRYTDQIISTIGGSSATVTLDATGNGSFTTLALTADTTYNLVSIASNGIPNCSQTLSGSAIITVNAIPTATISGTTTICSGTTANITFTGTPNATVTYNIDGGIIRTVLLDATGNGTVTTPALTVNSTYNLVRIDSNASPSCGQTLIGSATITIKALPTATISGSTTICSGTTATITFTGTPNATVTYTIDGAPSTTVTLDALGNGSVTTPTLTANSTYDLVSVATNGTLNCSQAQSGSVTITVNQLPTASITGGTICSGTAGVVTFNGTPNATITFKIGTGPNQNIVLDAAGTATLPTLVLTADTTYTLVSVSVTGVSNCSQTLTTSALVRVLPLPTATISGTTQLCLNSTAPQITFTGANGQSPYTFTYSLNSGFPQTISTVLGSDSVTLNAATNASGQFIYDLISISSASTPSCNQPQLGSAIVTILKLPTATISGNTQVCINDTAPQITFTGVNGLAPYTFNYKINNGPIQTVTSSTGNNSATLNVSTVVAGTFVYDLVSVSSATTPSCSQPQVGSATVIVKPASTLNTTSTTIQSGCVNIPISNIVLNIGGSATGATLTGLLPSGVTGALNAAGTMYTISGNPSQTGIYNFTVTTTGGCAPAAVVNGTITVNPGATISLSGTNTQSLCINTNISPIQYTIGNGAVSASVSAGGLPLGVTAIFSSGVLTISGTALQAGTFSYVVSTIGGCGVASLSGVITVKPEVNLTLTSAPITSFQSACKSSPITPIKYSVINGATSANVTGLPTGITGVYNAGVFIISGSSSLVGTFPYVVTTVGGCGQVSLNGTITINPNVTIALTSATTTTLQILCIGNPIVPITYEVGNGATGASLISGTVPDGIQGSFNQVTKIFTISGIAIEAGNFTYTISTTGGCGQATLNGTFRVNPLPVVNLPQDGFICVDVAGVPTAQYTLTTNLQSAGYGFVWSDINGVLAGETGNSYTASAPGYYSVKVTNLATGCFSSGGATIVPSLPPSQAVASVTNYFEDNQMVTISVTPPGDYLYQLDTGLFQSDPFFTNLFSGHHTITVKDKFGCGTAQDHFRIVNFPKFFTPNDDGYNDTWNITEIAEDQPDAYIYIFDRYGKLIREQSVIGKGWDGTLNGQSLPSTDYWFRVFYKENGVSKEFKSHFSLKR